MSTHRGAVELGKILGEELDVFAGGSEGLIRARALYAKRANLSAGGGIDAATITADVGTIAISGGDCHLDSISGDLAVEIDGDGSVEVQASDGLVRLAVTHTSANIAENSPKVTVHVPESVTAAATLIGADVEVDGDLAPHEMPTPEGLAGGARAVAIGCAPRGGSEVLDEGVPTGAAGGGGGRHWSGDGLPDGACAIDVDAPGCHVALLKQDWFTQRLKASERRRDRTST